MGARIIYLQDRPSFIEAVLMLSSGSPLITFTRPRHSSTTAKNSFHSINHMGNAFLAINRASENEPIPTHPPLNSSQTIWKFPRLYFHATKSRISGPSASLF